MGALVARLVARLKALPAAQRIVLGVGIPVVAVAAAVTVKRSPGGAPAAAPIKKADTPAVDGFAPPPGPGVGIPFGANLGDLFKFQTKLADIENQIRNSNAPTQDRSALPGHRVSPPWSRSGPQTVDDSKFVKVDTVDPNAAAQAAAADRAAAAGANARRAPVVATSTAAPRTTPPPTAPTTRAMGRSRQPGRASVRLATREREQTRAPVKPPVRLATRQREQTRTPAPRRPRRRFGNKRNVAM